MTPRKVRMESVWVRLRLMISSPRAAFGDTLGAQAIGQAGSGGVSDPFRGQLPVRFDPSDSGRVGVRVGVEMVVG